MHAVEITVTITQFLWFPIDTESIFGTYSIAEISWWSYSRTEVKAGIIIFILSLNGDISTTMDAIKHHHITTPLYIVCPFALPRAYILKISPEHLLKSPPWELVPGQVLFSQRLLYEQPIQVLCSRR